MATRSQVRADVDGLIGTDPHLSDSEINTLLQLRYEHVYEARLWSRSLREFTVRLVALDSSASGEAASVTQGSATVTFSGTPIASGDDGKQIQIGDDPQYFHVGFGTTSQITLENGEGTSVAWVGDTDTDASWKMFRTIYALPSTIDTVISVAGDFPIDELDGGREALDQLDPDRSTTGDHPKYWVYAGEDDSGNREIEVWPVPTQARLLRGQGGRKAPTLVDGTEVGINRALLSYAVAADCLNMLHAKTGDESYKALALFYERKSIEVGKDIGPKDLEKLSPASSLGRRSGRSLRGTDYEVTHDMDEP